MSDIEPNEDLPSPEDVDLVLQENHVDAAAANVCKDVGLIRRLVREQFGQIKDASSQTMGRFVRTHFCIDDALVSGAQLLRTLGYSVAGKGLAMSAFLQFLERYFPKVVADRLLTAYGHGVSACVSSLPSRRDVELSFLDADEREELMPSQAAYADKLWLHELEQPSGALSEVPAHDLWSLFRENERDESPEAMAGMIMQAQEMRRLLDTLSPMETQILRWRFGFEGKELTLREIGDRYCLSASRIQQIQENAFVTLRRQAHAVSTERFVCPTSTYLLWKWQKRVEDRFKISGLLWPLLRRNAVSRSRSFDLC